MSYIKHDDIIEKNKKKHTKTTSSYPPLNVTSKQILERDDFSIMGDIKWFSFQGYFKKFVIINYLNLNMVCIFI